jgi:hypothetical protein
VFFFAVFVLWAFLLGTGKGFSFAPKSGVGYARGEHWLIAERGRLRCVWPDTCTTSVCTVPELRWRE